MEKSLSKSPGLWKMSLIGGVLMALAPLSIDMYLPAFSLLANDLRSNESLVQLSLSIFFAGITLGQLLYGPISDRLGRKIPLITGLILFIAASLGCMITTNIYLFIFLRFIQSLGASGGMVIAQVMVSDVFKDRRKNGQVFSVLMLVLGVAPIIAPTLGGFLVLVVGWRGIFATLMGIGIAILFSIFIGLPETSGANPSIKMSAAFKSYSRVLKHPDFLRISLTRSFANAGLFVYVTMAPFIFTQTLKLNEVQFGLVFGITAIGLMLGNIINSVLLKKYSVEDLYKSSILIVAFFGIVSVILGFLPPTLFSLLPPLVGFMFGLGMMLPDSASLCLHGHGASTGAASSLMGCIQYGLAFAATGFMTMLSNSSIQSMTIGIAVCAILAAISERNLFFNARPQTV